MHLQKLWLRPGAAECNCRVTTLGGDTDASTIEAAVLFAPLARVIAPSCNVLHKHAEVDARNPLYFEASSTSPDAPCAFSRLERQLFLSGMSSTVTHDAAPPDPLTAFNRSPLATKQEDDRRVTPHAF